MTTGTESKLGLGMVTKCIFHLSCGPGKEVYYLASPFMGDMKC